MSSKESQKIIEAGQKVLLNNVGRQPLVLVKGQGTKVWDADGREYLDFVAGIATCALGHCPPPAARALANQAQTLWHVSNLYWNEPMVRLAEILTEASGLDRAFFCNSGAEANEAAIKMARKHSFDRFGPGRHVIVCAENSFHGRTMGAISATGQPRFHQGFEPMLPGFEFVPFGDIEALKSVTIDGVCAVMLEPVQGEGGVVVPPEGYLEAVSRLCRERDLLLIFDEIQTGLGRTGRAFAFQGTGAEPDIITLGKALGSGYPIGALLARENPAAALSPGTHSTTVGGAPLAMALSVELMKTILAPGFLAGVRDKGGRLVAGLSELKSKYPALVEQVRGQGLMLALVLKTPAAEVAQKLLGLGFLVNSTGGNVIRLVPPLNLLDAEIDRLVSALDGVLGEAGKEG
jgi:predicted acetylornithine/succinylornithine family transaminase